MLSRKSGTDEQHIAERVAVIDADIIAMQQQKHGYQTVITDGDTAIGEGQRLTHDATIQRDFAALMVDVLDGQIDEQLAARQALVPPPREPS